MNTIKSVVYGIGGFDKTKPNNNIVETIYYTDEEEANLQLQIEKINEKAALLSKLGISEDEAKLLLS